MRSFLTFLFVLCLSGCLETETTTETTISLSTPEEAADAMSVIADPGGPPPPTAEDIRNRCQLVESDWGTCCTWAGSTACCVACLPSGCTMTCR